MPQQVVVVGGSIAGLIHGLQHKRRGNNVTILERETGERQSHHAGIGFMSHLNSFLSKYDRTGVTPAFTYETRQFAWYRRPTIWTTAATQSFTSWGLMQRILRANFDATASAACPHPPSNAEGDGLARYLAGKRVIALEEHRGKDQILSVVYTDTQTGKQDSIDADLVIGADGNHSTVRQLVQVAHTEKYAGYIALRGTLPENMVSPEAVKYFSDQVTFNFAGQTYLVCYIIPSEDGSLEPGKRLFNWLCYYNVRDDSPEMAEIFTDIHGKRHQNTVPRDLFNSDVWKRARRGLQICQWFEELVEKTPNPFVTKVRDVRCDTASFYDGRVVLVGDAFTTLRPNMGAASEQAAFHSNSLEQVYQGKTTQTAWDEEVRLHAKRLILLNDIVGNLGRGTMFSLFKSVFVFLIFAIRQRFRCRSSSKL